MYARKTPLDLSCGINITIGIIGAKWKTCLIDILRDGAMRPSQIHRALADATPRVLNLQLKELEEHGVVSKTIYPELPPRSEYSLTDLGRELLPVLDTLEEWGENHREVLAKILGEQK